MGLEIAERVAPRATAGESLGHAFAYLLTGGWPVDGISHERKEAVRQRTDLGTATARLYVVCMKVDGPAFRFPTVYFPLSLPSLFIFPLPMDGGQNDGAVESDKGRGFRLGLNH